MSLETPKNYDKRNDYASPIGILKNYSSKDYTKDSHEQQFFKIKSNRLETELNEYKEENSILKSKVSDYSTTIQILKERIYVLENQMEKNGRRRSSPSFVSDSNFNSGMTSLRGSPGNESKYLSVGNNSLIMEKNQRNAISGELERLTKENRILKNEHEIQLSKLKDQNKRLLRKLSEYESSEGITRLSRINQIDEESHSNNNNNNINTNTNKQEQKVKKLQKANSELREEIQKYENDRKKQEERVKNSQEKVRSLSKENEELQVIISSKKRSDLSVIDLQKKNEDLNSEIQRLYAENQGLKSLKMVESRERESKVSVTSSPMRQSNTETSEQALSKAKKQIKSLKYKLERCQGDLEEKSQEIQNMLKKLQPLLSKNSKTMNRDEPGHSNRASLSILEVFLQKYKINSF